MNSFLQRMLLGRSSTEELNAVCEKGEQQDETVRAAEPSRGSWIKKLGNYSPRKCQVPASPTKTATMTSLDGIEARDSCEVGTPRKCAGSPQTPIEMPDLESIIREFETGFLSPSKQEAAADGPKQKNFVKKIVAAFEVKYKTYSELKESQEASLEASKTNVAAETPSKRRSSGLFGSPFKSFSDESRNKENLYNCLLSKQNQPGPINGLTGISPLQSTTDTFKRMSGIFGSPFKISSDEEEDLEDSSKVSEREARNEKRIPASFCTPSKDKSIDSKSFKLSGIFSSPFSKGSCKDTSRSSSDIYTSPFDLERHDSKDSSSDCSSLFKFDKEASSRISNFHFNSSKASFLDDTKTMDSMDLDVTLPEPEETIFLEGNRLKKTSTMINEFSTDEDNAVAQGNSCPDRTPKIVGAFLKKPIDVEDTSIDWIPITGRKLPRKRSLKKLLYSLTGKKYEKKNKLFSSARNLNEETRELQDSGYDEKSTSSTSLTSLISITEVLLQQGNSYIEPERRSTLRTFRSKNSLDQDEEEEDDDYIFCDSQRSASKLSRRKLLLSEVPREDVKLDLGPCYPLPSSSRMVTMSLDRKMSKKNSPPPVRPGLTRVPKHPFLSKIPKHPFVSTTKMDEDQEMGNCQGNQGAENNRNSRDSSVIVKNDLYEVEFCRSCDDIRPTDSSRSSSSSAASMYDVPRRFLSKSASELSRVFETVTIRREREPVYDVPRPGVVERPKSSVFEDAVSLKRRSTQWGESTTFSMYAVPRDLDCYYATVKPRNNKIYPNSELLRSFTDLSRSKRNSAF